TRAVRKIYDVKKPKDHGKPQAQQRVERAVDQSYQKLRVEGLHRSIFRKLVVAGGSPQAVRPPGCPSLLTSSPAGKRFPTAGGRPGRPAWCRPACNSPTAPWIRRA